MSARGRGGDGVLGLLGQWAQPGAGLDGLVDGGALADRSRSRGRNGAARFRGRVWVRIAASGLVGAAQRGVELGQSGGELVGAVGEFGEIAFRVLPSATAPASVSPI